MDADLITAFEGQAPTEVLLVTVEVDETTTIRWTDGGFVKWGSDTYAAEDGTYGVLSSVAEIEDGVDGQATQCALGVMPKDQTAFLALIDPDLQGATVTVHLGAVERATGLLVGDPDLLLRAEIDQPKLSGPDGALMFDLITEEARMLEPNDERRLTDAFHQSVWPGELGYSHVDGLTKKIYWRSTAPNNAIT